MKFSLALNNSLDATHSATLANFSSEDQYQQWYISWDETIVSAADIPPSFGLAVYHSAFMEGDSVVIWSRRYLGVKDMFVIVEDR